MQDPYLSVVDNIDYNAYSDSFIVSGHPEWAMARFHFRALADYALMYFWQLFCLASRHQHRSRPSLVCGCCPRIWRLLHYLPGATWSAAASASCSLASCLLRQVGWAKLRSSQPRGGPPGGWCVRIHDAVFFRSEGSVGVYNQDFSTRVWRDAPAQTNTPCGGERWRFLLTLRSAHVWLLVPRPSRAASCLKPARRDRPDCSLLLCS